MQLAHLIIIINSIYLLSGFRSVATLGNRLLLPADTPRENFSHILVYTKSVGAPKGVLPEPVKAAGWWFGTLV